MSEHKLIHVARISAATPSPHYLFLKQIGDYHYVWVSLNADGHEIETSVWGATIEEAIRLAYRYWNLKNFSPVNCGFLYTLPERDEHGVNALFYQMVESYLSSSGIFFDKEKGHNCIVHHASQEARQIMKNYLP